MRTLARICDGKQLVRLARGLDLRRAGWRGRRRPRIADGRPARLRAAPRPVGQLLRRLQPRLAGSSAGPAGAVPGGGLQFEEALTAWFLKRSLRVFSEGGERSMICRAPEVD
jgi:hypothetical protein